MNVEQDNSNSPGERLSKKERLKRNAAFITDTIHPVKNVLEEAKTQAEAVSEFESRDYQMDAWDAIWQKRDAGADRVLVHMATGLGKTNVAVVDYAKFRSDRQKAGKSARGLFVVHQTAIINQAKRRFGDLLPDTKRVKSASGRIDPDADMTFATFQSLTRNIDSMPEDAFDYIIYDEAHHIEADTYKKVVSHFKPDFQLGLTATPDRMDEKDITDHFGEAVYSKTLPEGIGEGYLANVDYRLMLDEEAKHKIASGYKPGSIAELNEILSANPSPKNIAKEITAAQQEIRDKTGLDTVKTIIFSPDIETANEIAEIMDGQSYHSGVGSKDARKDILSGFKNGDFETIVTRDMFNEGVDVPDAQLIVFYRSTQSKTIFEQQLGRGLRKTKDKDEVTVLDFVANAERIRLVRELGDEVREARKLGGDNGSGSGNGEGGDGSSNPESKDIDRSIFEFSQEIIDILDLYDYYDLKNQERVDWSEWTNEEIVELANSLSPGEMLTYSKIESLSKAGEFPSSNYIKKRFGSIVEFQRSCGFEVEERVGWPTWTNEEIVELANSLSPGKELTVSVINSLSKAGEFPSIYVIKKRFGSIVEFQRSCGFEVEERMGWPTWTNEEIVELANSLSPGKILTFPMINSLSKAGEFPSTGTIAGRFGSIVEFQRSCGFEVEERVDWSTWTNEEIVELANSLSPGKMLTGSMINNLSKAGEFPGSNYTRKRFGSMAEFQRACGFEVEERVERVERVDWSTWTNEEIVEHANVVSPGGTLTFPMIKSLSKAGEFPSTSTILRRFGSIVEFQRACGFEVEERVDWSTWTNEEIVEKAKVLSPGEMLTAARISSLSKAGEFPSSNYIRKRFGSLAEFRKACGFQPDVRAK